MLHHWYAIHIYKDDNMDHADHRICPAVDRFPCDTWLLREGGHITTDILYVHLNQSTKRYLNGIMFVIGGFACAAMVVFGVVHLYECIAGRVTDVRAVTVPKAAVFIIIPVGSILLTLQFFRMAWTIVFNFRRER